MADMKHTEKKTTIEVSWETWRRINALKRPKESFDDVLKRVKFVEE